MRYSLKRWQNSEKTHSLSQVHIIEDLHLSEKTRLMQQLISSPRRGLDLPRIKRFKSTGSCNCKIRSFFRTPEPLRMYLAEFDYSNYSCSPLHYCGLPLFPIPIVRMYMLYSVAGCTRYVGNSIGFFSGRSDLCPFASIFFVG